MSLPTDPVDLFVLAAFIVLAPFILYRVFYDTFSAYLPAERAKVPKAGKLEKLLSADLKAFIASLPRPSGDPLAATFEALPRESLQYFDNHGYVNALYSLWQFQGRYALAVRSWSKRVKEHTEFVWSGAKPDDEWDVRAYSEQGFFADTVIELLKSQGPAREAARALGFKYMDETQAWFLRWSQTDWSRPVDEDDEDDTPRERQDAERFSFVCSIDNREGIKRPV